MDTIKRIVKKVASRKLAVTAVAGATAVTGTIKLTLSYGWGGGGVYRRADGDGYVRSPEVRRIGKVKRDGCEGRPTVTYHILPTLC